MKYPIKWFLVLFLFQSASLYADHICGGELTWQCQPNGQFVFTLKLYRDCNGIPGSFGATTINSNSPVPNITMNFTDTNDITPVCNPDPFEPHITCAGAVIGGTDTGAVEEYIYQSNPVSIAGVPPPGGWTFSWLSCCRNIAVSNLVNPVSTGFAIRAKMYAYNGRNTYPCFDSSPQFFEKPNPVYCTGFQNSSNQNSADVDLDSLTYDWADALNNSTSIPCTYASGYTFDNPLPDVSENILNAGAVINPINGEITFTSFTSGSFVVCTKASSWKCGVLVAEVFRDYQVIIKGCRPLIANQTPPIINYQPTIQAPFISVSGNPSFIDTVFAGDTAQFIISSTDFDLDPFSNFQTMHMEASGLPFSSDFTSTTACLNPPCATISPNPMTTSGQGAIQFDFHWITTCDHVLLDTACQALSTVHNFVFRMMDDFCPFPGTTLFTVSIVVLPPPGSPAHPDVFQAHDTLFCSVPSNTYQWFQNDSAILGANSNYYIPSVAGRYSVEAIPVTGCPAKSASFSYTPVGIFFPEFEYEISLSPNPFSNSVFLSAKGRKPVPLHVVLTDALGKTISAWSYSSLYNLQEEYPLSFLSAGIYLLQFKTETSQKTFRLVKID